jgi:predicted nucleotidyltransferase
MSTKTEIRLPDFIRAAQPALDALCRAHGVHRLALFGSAATKKFDPVQSDLDFVVEFEDQGLVGAFDRYFGLREGLEALFGRPVDLVTDPAPQNPYFRDEVRATARTLFLRA